MSDKPSSEAPTKKPHCGVIIPISGSVEYSSSHWAEVLKLVKESAQAADFTCEVVSATGRDDIIHDSIVTNIYHNEIVVCDVSSRNPNVMLELGLRLASKLPIVIIFDEQGNYPFDIGTIRYLPYRKDMRYYDIEEFKKQLTTKLLEVYQTHLEGSYKSFLSQFKNVKLDLDTVSTESQTLKEFIESIDKRLSGLESKIDENSRPSSTNSTSFVEAVKQSLSAREIKDYLAAKSVPLDIKAPLTLQETERLIDAFRARFKPFASAMSTHTLYELIERLGNEALSEAGRSKYLP